MTTSAFPFLTPFSVMAALRRSWLVAIVEAAGSGVAALLLGPAGVDPEVGFSR
jgi:hypothetical protein